LIDSGANILIKNTQSLLHSASEAPNTVKLLLEVGCPVNEKNCNGDTPLHFAHNLECVKMLIEHGADLIICFQ
jgi:ankyrin repeat protein